MLKIVIPGEPVAWARAGVCGRGRKPIFYDTQKKYKWQLKQFMLHALTNYVDGDSSASSAHFKSGGFDVSIRLYISPPKTLPTKAVNLLSWGFLDKTTKADIDNFSKLIFDAGNQTLWDDDAQIVSLYVKKYFCNDGKPRTEIVVSPRKKQENASKVLSEVNLDEVENFCAQAEMLGGILSMYKGEISREVDPDELYASSIAYHLTKIIDDHSAMIKKLDKHKKLWQNINAEANPKGVLDC